MWAGGRIPHRFHFGMTNRFKLCCPNMLLGRKALTSVHARRNLQMLSAVVDDALPAAASNGPAIYRHHLVRSGFSKTCKVSRARNVGATWSKHNLGNSIQVEIISGSVALFHTRFAKRASSPAFECRKRETVIARCSMFAPPLEQPGGVRGAGRPTSLTPAFVGPCHTRLTFGHVLPA